MATNRNITLVCDERLLTTVNRLRGSLSTLENVSSTRERTLKPDVLAAARNLVEASATHSSAMLILIVREAGRGANTSKFSSIRLTMSGVVCLVSEGRIPSIEVWVDPCCVRQPYMTEQHLNELSTVTAQAVNQLNDEEFGKYVPIVFALFTCLARSCKEIRSGHHIAELVRKTWDRFEKDYTFCRSLDYCKPRDKELRNTIRSVLADFVIPRASKFFGKVHAPDKGIGLIDRQKKSTMFTVDSRLFEECGDPYFFSNRDKHPFLKETLPMAEVWVCAVERPSPAVPPVLLCPR
jgi:hypothetical protein